MVSHRIRHLALAVLGTLGLAAAAHAQEADSGRVIVKLRPADAPELRTLQAVEARRQTLSARVGAELDESAGPAPDMSLMRADGMSADELARRLEAQPDVEYAVPDRRKKLLAMPNDPRLSQQWELLSREPAAIRADSAWELSTGRNVVVAVVDSGVRYEHEDLAGILLPGYDFVSGVAAAGDGDGRDADASDPGDYLSSADLLLPELADCSDSPTYSSWHGTRVAGLVAGIGNNGRGIAGVAWQARILPVRAFGKCGGMDSDLLAALRWAGGLDVPGVPRNPNPAHIINLSFGGPGTCSMAYRSTVAELNANGVSIFAAAGNEAEAILEPANCPDVAGVVAVDQDGALADYSNRGPEALLAAPGGNCYYDRAVGCDYQLTTTTNLGLRQPGGDAYTTPDLDATYGTSFASPIAAGVAALMLGAHPDLQPEAIYRRLSQGSAPFISGFGSQTCTTALCGAGMLDARNAVELAFLPQVRIVMPQRMDDGRYNFDGSYSSAAAGRTPVAWQWHSADESRAQFLSPNAASSLLQVNGYGIVRLALTVSDDRGQSDTLHFDFDTASGDAGVVGTSQPQPQPQPQPRPDDSTDDDDGGGGGAVDIPATLGLLLLGGIAWRGRRRRDDVS